MGSTSAKKILIVEDDMLLSLVEERFVQKLGHNVVAKTGSGEDAIKKTAEFSPDLIMMDIILKGEMDGIETMEAIRKESEVPVIYLSGNSDRLSYERARKTKFVDYLVKPIDYEDLKKSFQKVFGKEAYGVSNSETFSNIQLNKTA